MPSPQQAGSATPRPSFQVVPFAMNCSGLVGALRQKYVGRLGVRPFREYLCPSF